MAVGRKTIDEEARTRASTDLAHSLCIEAGAGTGKTTILVSRFLAIVESGLARCSQIVAITFTEKAAAEMKMRLREEIEKRLLEDSRKEEVHARLREALYELERSAIGTIHSFAATILREFPLEADIDPYFAQLDDIESGVLFDRCWEDFIETLREDDRLAVRWFLILGGSPRKLRDMAKMWYSSGIERHVEGIFKKRRHRRGTGSDMENSASDSLSRISSLADEFRAYLGKMSEELSSMARSYCVNRGDKGFAAISDLSKAVELSKELEDEDLVQFLFSLSIPKGKGNKGNWKPGEKCTEQKEIFKEIEETRRELTTNVMDLVRGSIETVLERFSESLEESKNARSAMDFDDLLIKARNLLNNEEVRRQLAKRYRFILVDEFQDTDTIQSEIIYLLSLCEGSGDKEKEEIAQGKLFIVGDPKQSIYRFRGADIEVYESFKDRLSRSGEIVQIVQNFRSVPGIVNWVNTVFSNVIKAPEDGRYQSDYEPIHPFRDGRGVSIVYIDTQEDHQNIRSDEARSIEAEAIARTIHKLVDSDYRIFDRKTGRYVPVDYRHIAIIYPTTTGIEHYEDILRFEGIPYIVEGGKLYFARQEVRELVAAMWAIEDPEDSLALVATLRSSLFGFSDEELFLFKRKFGELKPTSNDESLSERFFLLMEALKLIRELHEKRNLLGVYGTIKELIERTNFIELSLIRPHGEQKVLNIRKVLHRAHEFDATGYPFRRFARWFSERERDLSREEESPVVEDDENAVRLLTMHKAKGLQFPVVIMANLIQGVYRSSSSYIIDGSRIEFKIDGNSVTSGFNYAKDTDRKREIAEKVRLLYMAATRAQDLLILPIHGKRGSYIELISPYLPPASDISLEGQEDGAGRIPSVEKPGRENVEEPEVEGARIEKWALNTLPSLKGERKVFVRMPSHRKELEREALGERNRWLKEHARIVEKGSRAKAAIIAASSLELEAFDENSSLAFPSPAGDYAARVGIAFHRVMEIVDFERKVDHTAIVEKVCRELDLESRIEEVVQLVDTSLDSEVLKEVFSSENFYREVPFFIPLEGNYISGRIDLLFKSKGKWNILDYKTDFVEQRDIDRKGAIYRQQAGVYVLALDRLGIGPIGKVSLYFVRPHALKVFESPEEILREAKETIRKFS